MGDESGEKGKKSVLPNLRGPLKNSFLLRTAAISSSGVFGLLFGLEFLDGRYLPFYAGISLPDAPDLVLVSRLCVVGQ